MRGLLGAASAVALALAGPAMGAPPPASAFGRIPAVVDAEISPNGQRVAILGGAPEQRYVSIATIDQPGLPILRLGSVEGLTVRWAGDDHVIATIQYFETLPDQKRSYSFERHISVNPEGKAVARLLQNGVTAGNRFVTSMPILRMTAGSAARVMMVGLIENTGASAGNDSRIQRKGEGGAARALFRVDPANGQGQLVERGGFDTVSWSVDSSGEPRVRTDIDEVRHTVSVYGRAKGAKQWSPIFTNAQRDGGPDFIGYLEPEDSVLIREGETIVRRSLATGAVTPFDIKAGERSIWDEARGAVVGLMSDGDRPVYRWLDGEIGAAHGVLQRAFSDRRVTMWSWSADRSRFIARVAGPLQAPAWYLYDKPRKEVSVLAQEYPELADAKLGKMTWRPYAARDGLTIPAYVTMPADAVPGRRLPLVVLPHDHVHGRDAYGFNYLAQFIASRGYVVLQPQYRGSSGFGLDFAVASRGEWGGKIQTDLLDGVAALAASGEIDPARVCIVGVGFGGYSALAGAAFHPDAYRCAASIAGYSDLGRLVTDQIRLYAPESTALADTRTELGGASLAQIAAASPNRHAAAVRAPILLVHGDKDTDVDIAHSRTMADQLRAAGKPFEFLMLEGETHDLVKAASRTRTLEAIEGFLAKHLPAD